MSNGVLHDGERITDVGGRVRLISNGSGLPWGTDAYLLAAYIRHAGRACELGCGSGVISLLCAAHGHAADITALEIRPDMTELAERNAALNGLDGSLHVLCRDIREICARDFNGVFDTVFANPPYISHPGAPKCDPASQDARHEMWGGIGDFCAAAARLLRQRGSFYCVFRPERLADLFCAMRAAKLEPKRMTEIYPDVHSRPSAVLVEAKYRAAPSLAVSPPLIMYRDPPSVVPRVMTERAAAVYRDCSFYGAEGLR